jgi:hypothetical protein
MKPSMKRLAAALAAAMVVAAGAATWSEHSAHAWIRGGGFRGGGFRGASRTTWVPGVGVSRTTVRGGFYGGGYYGRGYGYYALINPSALAIARPGAIAGITARSIGGAFRYDPSTGFAYRFGPAVARLPGGCTATFWRGIGAFACAGTTYTYDVEDGVTKYIPVDS